MTDYKNIVVLTGAGISAESGLQTFRDSGGLWEGQRVEDVATPEAFAANPAFVQEFYNLRRQQLLLPSVTSNAAHHALAAFEQSFLGEFTLVTQNIDNLHQRAGSKHVFPMHGELLKARCVSCDSVCGWSEDILAVSTCGYCGSRGSLRPHIVWFGEMPLYMSAIEEVLERCDLFVSIGTSSVVYPAAGFAQVARYNGATTVELNLEPSSHESKFDKAYYGLATQVVPNFFAKL
ncbi:MAG: NAD-dependent deacylase [Pseudomonadales bacterium]|nr:NAD-dependent deacylase [Pseudomonadales bacterium]MDG2079022.1 NAD-dependent deacylase [Pseudomonadales bacterium]